MNLQSLNKPAKKILVIGGSTYNPCTPCKIRDALVASNFLEEWAVIFANHLYFKLYNPKISLNSYKFKIASEWSEINLGFIDKPDTQYIDVTTGYVYILPDSSGGSLLDWIYGNFKIYQELPIIEVLEPQTSFQEISTWLECNKTEALGRERDYLPYVDKVMYEVANSHSYLDKIAGLILCGKDGDGAYGLQAIKVNGGATAVQIPNECRYSGADSMPNTAQKIEPSHDRVSLEDPHSPNTLTGWLRQIK